MKFGKLTTLNLSDQVLGNNYLQLPVGTMSSRPAAPLEGMMRYNLDTGGIEGYSRKKWTGFLSTADFRIPGASLPEDENVTISSLAMLLRQFQRTIVGGVDVLGKGVSNPDDTSLSPQATPEGSPGTGDLDYIVNVNRGSIRGWMDESGKGVNFISGRVESTHGGHWQSFEVMIDAFKMSGFEEADRHNYIFDYFANIYRYSYKTGDYVTRGLTSSISPAWDLLNPWTDPNYGKFVVHVSLCKENGGRSDDGAGMGFIKWFVKLVRFRDFKLQNVPDLLPGGGSEPMPEIVDIVVDGADYSELTLQNYLLRKYPTWELTPVTAYIHVKPGWSIYSRDNQKVALDLRGLPVGSLVYVKNEGHLLGPGGMGGTGGGYDLVGNTLTLNSAEDGGRGGIGLAADSNASVFLDNTNGFIYAGGGGGGGGAVIPVLATHSATFLSQIGGGGGGAGGAEQLRISEGGFGAGELDSNPNDPTDSRLVSTDLRGTNSAAALHRDANGINIQGTNGGDGGIFLDSTILSGGSGGTGGDSGVSGTPGESIVMTPNIIIVGWTSTDQLSANQRLTFGDDDITMDQIPNFSTDHTQNDWNWFTANVIPALNGNAGADYTIEGFNNQISYETFNGVVNPVQLIYGFVIKSTVLGTAGYSTSISKTGDGVVYLPWTSSRGGLNITYPGGAGGGAGNSIAGASTIEYAQIDTVARTCNITDKATSGGTIVGNIV